MPTIYTANSKEHRGFWNDQKGTVYCPILGFFLEIEGSFITQGYFSICPHCKKEIERYG